MAVHAAVRTPAFLLLVHLHRGRQASFAWAYGSSRAPPAVPVWDALFRLVSHAPASLTPAALARIVWAITEARGVVTGHAGALRCKAWPPSLRTGIDTSRATPCLSLRSPSSTQPCSKAPTRRWVGGEASI